MVLGIGDRMNGDGSAGSCRRYVVMYSSAGRGYVSGQEAGGKVKRADQELSTEMCWRGSTNSGMRYCCLYDNYTALYFYFDQPNLAK